MNRVVVYGCSHAYGSEIIGPGKIISPQNVKLSFGSLVADHYGRPLRMSARPGGSNRQIMLNAIEHTQPGDLCLLSWTYFPRENWFARSNDDFIESEIFNGYHTTEAARMAMSKYKGPIPENPGSQLITHYDKIDIKAFSTAQVLYYQHETIQALNFLQIYAATNAIIKQRGATPLNLHFDCDFDVLQLINGEIPWPSDNIFDSDYYNDFGESEILLTMPKADQLQIFSDYREDESFIRFYDKNHCELPFRKWVCDKWYDDMLCWPGGRHGHLGPEEHKKLSEIIIDRLNNK